MDKKTHPPIDITGLTQLPLLHWAVIALSILLTLFAWDQSSKQKREEAKILFDHEVDQMVHLIAQKLEKYELVLWSGVATLQMNDFQFSASGWEKFEKGLQLSERYLGASRIGVFETSSEEKAQSAYSLSAEVHPEGLKTAEDSGLATLAVSARADHLDNKEYFFLAPFFEPKFESQTGWQSQFRGVVYAKFDVDKFFLETLDEASRHVGVKVFDDGKVLFDEHQAKTLDFDSRPLFEERIEIEIYGRKWQIDFRSSYSFRSLFESSEPTTILVAGLIIDFLLLIIFLSLANSKSQASRTAQSVSLELNKRTQDLERSNAELGQFAYIASHDLQAPLRHIATYAEFLKKDLDGQSTNKEIKKYIEVIVSSVGKMQNLIKDLLLFSRVGSEGLKKSKFRPEELIREITKPFELEADEKKAKIVIDMDDEFLMADRSKMAQVFQNLISNSLNYASEERNLQVVIRGKKDDQSWLFSVEDNGIGVAPEYREKVFQAFQRLHDSSSYPGTGIGLAICKKAVDLHEGQIWMEEGDTNGCKVCIKI